MSDPSQPRSRPSIAERAARRERLEQGGRDRYSTLVRALQAGREVPLGRTREMPFEWHPVIWTLLRLALVAVALYIVGLVAWNWWRDQQVDTWAGPAGITVESGQRLAGCVAANVQRDDLMPTWVRFDGTVYVRTSRIRPVIGESRPGETQYVESGYDLGRLRILLIDEHRPGEAPGELILASPPASGGRIYGPDPTCS